MAFWIFYISIEDSYIDSDYVIETLDIEPAGKNEDEDRYFTYDEIFKNVKKSPEKYLWEMICLDTNDSEREGYFDYNANYAKNETLSAFYDLLVKMGYEMSDEEKKLRDGTHPLFSEKAEE